MLTILTIQKGFDFDSPQPVEAEGNKNGGEDEEDDFLGHLENVVSKHAVRASMKGILPGWKPTSDFGDPLAFQLVKKVKVMLRL